MLFAQRNGGEMKMMGIINMEEEMWDPSDEDDNGNEIECRYLGVNADVAEGTCVAAEGSNWPFDGEEDQCPFEKPLMFYEDGNALVKQMANASLYYDDVNDVDSIIGQSLSIHFGMDKTDYDIDACCTITQMLREDGRPDRPAFREAKRAMK